MPLKYSRCLDCPVRGDCCYFSTLIDGRYNIILPDHPCIYLNTDTGLCTIYKDRKKHYPDCLDWEDAKKIGGLPEECLFLKKGEELPYPPKRRLTEDDNERLWKRMEYVNAFPHKHFQKEGMSNQSTEFMKFSTDKLKEEKTT